MVELNDEDDTGGVCCWIFETMKRYFGFLYSAREPEESCSFDRRRSVCRNVSTRDLYLKSGYFSYDSFWYIEVNEYSNKSKSMSVLYTKVDECSSIQVNHW